MEYHIYADDLIEAMFRAKITPDQVNHCLYLLGDQNVIIRIIEIWNTKIASYNDSENRQADPSKCYNGRFDDLVHAMYLAKVKLPQIKKVIEFFNSDTDRIVNHALAKIGYSPDLGLAG